MRLLRWLPALALLLLAVSDADGVRFRRPFHGGHALFKGYDNNGNAGGCVDYACGGKCYDTHTGNDYPMPVGTDILAGATGTVTRVVQGCADYGYLNNPCGSYCGNHVRIAHNGGSSVYCHLKNGSVTVREGQQVGCGQKIGESASSGSSTGPHLHFGWNPGGGAARDPYTGRCSNGGNAWVDQGPYDGVPGTACENNCECNPGQTEARGCGRCGRQTRTCGGNCRWGGWSGCEGQGPCAPGDRQEEACCDCGRRARTCGGNCQWQDWGACGGPNPPGPPPCDTGKPGVCADGAIECVQGCLTCVDQVEPSPERCDDLDNDCDAVTDEDATEIGDPPARYAAVIEDLSAPMALRPGDRAEVWAVLRNVGTEPWPAGAAWLTAVTPPGEASELWDRTTWSAHDVPAELPAAVPPGGRTTVVFPVQMPTGATGAATWFNLSVAGNDVICPSPGFEVAPEPLTPGYGGPPPGFDAPDTDREAPRAPAEAPPRTPTATEDAALRGNGGCTQRGGPAPTLPWLLLAPLALRRRRRSV